VASRRRAEQMIVAGRVRVNGRVVTELGTRVDAERDTVEVDGARVRPAEPVWLALHKPPGVLVARRDTHGRRTVYTLLPRRYRGLFHVGRLDLESEGLILLTNEGETAHRLLHPRHGVRRVYEVAVRGAPPTEGTLRRLRSGVRLADGLARAVAVERVRRGAEREDAIRAARDAGRGGGGEASRASGAGRADRSAHAAVPTTWLRLTLEEGRKREVRRMLESVGHPVERLVRVRYGPIALGALPQGRWRRLDRDEVTALRAAGKPKRG